MAQPAAAAAAVTALGGLCLAWGLAVEPRAFRLRRFQVPLLPAGRSPIRILHLSDLHLLAGQSHKIAWIAALADTAPDLVVNTGDNLAEAAALPALVRALGPLAGIPGVFVFGSNDLFGPRPLNPLGYLNSRRSFAHARAVLPTAALRLTLEGLGWTDLEQARTVVDLRGSRIELRGCGDAHMEADDYPAVMGPVETGTDLLIGVTHAPYRRVLDQMADDGAGLILAGHTHGGQVCLPGGRALTTNCDLPLRQAKGLSRHHRGSTQPWLHVSAGLGASPYAPYRFCCPPEATLLTLTARS